MTVYINPPHGSDETGVVTTDDVQNFARPFKTLEVAQASVAQWRAADKTRAKQPVRIVETHRPLPSQGAGTSLSPSDS